MACRGNLLGAKSSHETQRFVNWGRQQPINSKLREVLRL
jgi:hypothetical protein